MGFAHTDSDNEDQSSVCSLDSPHLDLLQISSLEENSHTDQQENIQDHFSYYSDISSDDLSEQSDSDSCDARAQLQEILMDIAQGEADVTSTTLEIDTRTVICESGLRSDAAAAPSASPARDEDSSLSRVIETEIDHKLRNIRAICDSNTVLDSTPEPTTILDVYEEELEAPELQLPLYGALISTVENRDDNPEVISDIHAVTESAIQSTSFVTDFGNKPFNVPQDVPEHFKIHTNQLDCTSPHVAVNYVIHIDVFPHTAVGTLFERNSGFSLSTVNITDQQIMTSFRMDHEKGLKIVVKYIASMLAVQLVVHNNIFGYQVDFRGIPVLARTYQGKQYRFEYWATKFV